MMRTRTTAPILGLVLLAGLLAIAGCGGGGSSTSTAARQVSTSAVPTSSDTAQGASPPSANTRPRQSPQRVPARPVERESVEKTSPAGASTDPEPLPNEGTSAIAPGVPTVKGGDNSIQAYGVEGESEQRIAATRLVGSYLAALAAGEWEAACARLSAVVQEQLTIAAQRAPKVTDKSCAGALAALGGEASAAERASAAQIHVLSYRVDGNHAFVIYRDGAGGPFNLPLRSEGGRWRVSAVSGIELVL